MNMKVMTAKDAKNSFGTFLDTVQREPVVITKRDRPVGVMLSMDNVPAILELADSLNMQIRSGVAAGLVEAEAGLGREVTAAYVDELKAELTERIKSKTKA